ncbi:MAG: hypothetical protein AAGD25_32450 [Cyanobacteria bacterium P01_F01_bin.150]
MLFQEAKRFLQVSVMLASELNYLKCKWAITGSYSLLLNGVDVIPRDIDVFINQESCKLLEEELAHSFELRPFTYTENPGIRSYFTTLNILDIKVELVAGMESYISGKWFYHLDWDNNLVCHTIQEEKIFTTSLDYELEIYNLLDKRQKVKSIHEYLNTSKNKVNL